ncbi:hypothetical protein [Georgenia sp. AZ-5]|uniref:hypothetical protein n=1 Tax=Georgenia sp. AZ-5 TaxID=3367526 RepID=UPI0037550B69
MAASTWAASRPAARYRYLVEATVSMMRTTAVLSHESAAVLLGLPVIGPWPDRVHVVEPLASGGRSTGMIFRHGVRELPRTVQAADIAVTNVARTVLDLARTRSFASGLAAADFALAVNRCTELDLWEELERLRGTRGFRAARHVVERADGRSESVGESLSRARMYELRLPIPELQQSSSTTAGSSAAATSGGTTCGSSASSTGGPSISGTVSRATPIPRTPSGRRSVGRIGFVRWSPAWCGGPGARPTTGSCSLWSWRVPG